MPGSLMSSRRMNSVNSTGSVLDLAPCEGLDLFRREGGAILDHTLNLRDPRRRDVQANGHLPQRVIRRPA